MAKKPTPVQDPTLPKVDVTVGGKKYFLCFDFNALAVAEDATGLNLLRSLDFQNLSAKTFRALLFAALLRQQPDMTLEAAGSLITASSAPKLTEALVRAYMESNPEADESESAPKNAE